MKIKKVITFVLAIFALNKILSIFAVPFSNQKTNETNYKIAERFEADRSVSSNAFVLAKTRLLQEYENLVDVTGLNVTDKENITLPNFNPNYIFPGFQNVSCDYFEDVLSDFSSIQNNYLNQIRTNHPKVHKHLELTERGFENIDITPAFYNGIMRSFDILALINILTLAGLSDAAIVAFTGAVSSIAIIVFNVFNAILLLVLVALITVFLVTLVTIIIEEWNDICAYFDDIANWFYTSFSQISSFFEEVFDYIETLAYQSSIIGTISIGDTTFQQEEISFKYAKRIGEIVNLARLSQTIALFCYVREISFVFLGFVSFQFCVDNKTHNLGFSSYTWSKDTARRLILQAGNGVTTVNPEITEEPEKDFIYMYHFHNCTEKADGTYTRCEDTPFSWCHSFYGSFYIRNEDGGFDIHEDSPIYLELLPGGSIVS